MASLLIIPIIVVAVIGLTGYFVYRFVIFDFMCKRAVNQNLQKYNIKKTPSQIIQEYYKIQGKEISQKEVKMIEKQYRQNEPEQFLVMYDSIRDLKHQED